MISNASKRTILRCTHLVLSIPVLGYIYGKPAEVQQYASVTRFVFVPVIILSGFWMYAGVWPDPKSWTGYKCSSAGWLIG